MKNKKGFTLIELLAVIVILGIIASISVVSVNNIRKKQDEENRKNVISSILTGAKRYVADHPEKLNFSSEVTIMVSTLLTNEKYVDFDQNKYSEFSSGKVYIGTCKNNLKLLYYIKINDEFFNDCGCETQAAGNAKKICSGNSCEEDGSCTEYNK